MVEQSKIPNLDGLTELANRDGVDIKPTLLRVMTDLYVQKAVHSAEEERHYTELAVRLIDQVDVATRTIVAGRLANYPAAPHVITEHLARGRSQRGETAPTPRTDAPATGKAATLTELSELFLTADGQERRMILLHLDYADLPPAAPLAPQVAQESIRCLEMAALGHNNEGFAHEIERALGIERSLARRLIDDQSGEPILVMALALGMPADVLQRILLCLNPAISHSVLRVYELSKLYEEMEPQSASRLLAIWQAIRKPAQRPGAQQPNSLQPQHYDDGKQQPAIPARPAIRWDEHLQWREG
jgi:uncharacterized protein (DUF2336 family)